MVRSENTAAEAGQRFSWIAAHRLMGKHFLRHFEILVEHFVSLPLPILRYDQPAFAFYAGASVRQPNIRARYLPPDRHWTIAALGGSLLFYARTSILPLAPPGTHWTPAEGDRPAVTVQVLRDRLTAFEPMIDQATATFFDGGMTRFGAELANEITKIVVAPMLDFYRAIAPDFWAWLGAQQA